MGKSRSDLIIALVFGISIALGLSIQAGWRFGFQAGLIYFGIFGSIVGLLLLMFFLGRR